MIGSIVITRYRYRIKILLSNFWYVSKYTEMSYNTNISCEINLVGAGLGVDLRK